MSEGGRGGVSERGGWGGVRERGGWSEWKGKEKVHYMYWCQLPPSSPLSHSFPSPFSCSFLSLLPSSFLLLSPFPSYPSLFLLPPPPFLPPSLFPSSLLLSSLPSYPSLFLLSPPPSFLPLSPFLLIPLYSSFPLLPSSLSPPLPSYPSLFLLPPPPFLPPSNHSGRTEQQAWEANKDLYRSDMIVKRSFQTLILSCFAVYELDTPPLLPAIVWIKPHA